MIRYQTICVSSELADITRLGTGARVDFVKNSTYTQNNLPSALSVFLEPSQQAAPAFFSVGSRVRLGGSATNFCNSS
jgi:hypothetical protein